MVGYGSTVFKARGIYQQSSVLEKVLKFLTSKGYIVNATPATFEQDTRGKIDYFLNFDSSTPFLGKFIVPIDVKYAKTYTIISHNQTNVLEESRARYIILNHPSYTNKLLWLSVEKLRECIKLHAPKLYDSFEPGNNSKFIYIFDYVEKHKNFFGKAAMEVEVPSI